MISTTAPFVLAGREAISLACFGFFTILSLFRRMARPQRWRAIALGAAAIVLTLASAASPGNGGRIFRDWLPALLVLMLYWQAGQLLREPNRRLQRWLESFDDKHLRAVLDSYAASRGWVHAYLEFAYLLCYPLVPLGVGILYLSRSRQAVNAYWWTVLPAAYACYLVLPFVHTLPPRLAANTRPLAGKLRDMNLSVLRHMSITVNTFPSAHVAATLAASLVIVRTEPWMGALFLLFSGSIAVAAVAGRYHYALDVLAGATVAIIAFLAASA